MILDYQMQVAAALGTARALAPPRAAMRPITDRAQQLLAVRKFPETAVEGDVPAFVENLSRITWPGAWAEVFAEIVSAGWVHPDTRHAFVRAWRGFGRSGVGRPRDAA